MWVAQDIAPDPRRPSLPAVPAAIAPDASIVHPKAPAWKHRGMLMRSFWILLAGLVFAGCAPPKRELRLFVWPEYIDPKIIAEFEAAFDCRIVVDHFDDGNLMIAKLASGGSGIYDVVATSNESLPGMLARGLLAPLRYTNIPNAVHLDPRFRGTTNDVGSGHGVPCAWGTTGLYVRKPKGKPLEESWALLFDPAKQPGPIALLDDGRFAIGAALWYQGHSINSVDARELESARDLVINTTKRSAGFVTSIAGRNRVLAGELGAAIVSSSDGVRGEKEDPETSYFVPREGGAIWFDTLSIPAHAPHRDLAEQFINYILRPEVSARFAKFAHLATPNLAAMEFVDREDRENRGLYPPAEAMLPLEFVVDLGEKIRLYDELWTQIKAR